MILQNLVHITLVVDDYDKAIQFYTEKLNFRVVEDTVLSETKRWVLMAPPGNGECYLLLGKVSDCKYSRGQQSHIQHQRQ